MWNYCFGSKEENLPLVVNSNVAGKFICDPKDILTSGIPTGVVTVAGAFSSYGFVRYSQDFLKNYIGKVSDVAGYFCGVPIALLSGASGGKVITSIISNPIESGKTVLKNVFTLGLWNREDLWQRDLDSKVKWYLLQSANLTAGLINFVATPLSVIASDALNYSHSGTWISTGPNTASSFLMNGFYLKRILDLFLNKFAAWLGDVEPEKRSDVLKMLEGLKKELPNYAKEHQLDFFAWLNEFVDCKDNKSKLLKLAELQTSIREPKPSHYDTSWSIPNILMLILKISMLLPAIVFTLPLVHAGEKARDIFENYRYIDFIIGIVSWEAISASSFICNLMINGVNAYNFGNDIGEMLRAIYNDGVKSYFGQFQWKDYVRIGGSVFLGVLAAIAQMGAAADNPIIASLVTPEIILVGLAALALYFKASSNYTTRVVDFSDRWGLRNIQDFAGTYNAIKEDSEKQKYIDVLSRVVQEQIDQVENEVQRAAYKAGDHALPLNIEGLAADNNIMNAVQSIPKPEPSRWCSCWCSLFGRNTGQQRPVEEPALQLQETYTLNRK